MRHYYVYILQCSDNSFYTGVTNDYKLRVEQHQKGLHPQAYTYKRRPVRLVYLSFFDDVHLAISWEKQIKRWTRKKKMALIEGEYAKLSFLSHSLYGRRIQYLIVMVRRAHHDILTSSP